MSASAPPSFSSRLTAREVIAEGTMAFRFERPAPYPFRAGQAMDVTLISPPETDAEGDTRTFSIASAPSTDELMVATRMRDTAFKRVLGRVPLGTPVRLSGPMGSLTLHNDSRRTAVLLAGGIGITPFRSIVLHAATEKLPHHLYLFYSNHRPEDAPFLEELRQVEQVNAGFHFVPTMDGMERSHRTWNGEVGHVDAELLRRHLKAPSSPIYYLAGPPGFVAHARGSLESSGVDSDDIRTEEFSGY